METTTDGASYFDYIDGIVFMAGLLGAVLYTLWLRKNATVEVRLVPLFLAAFGASIVTSSMAVGHLFENSFRAAVRAAAGTFVFNFHFYSIILMGLVILSFGIYLLGQLRFLTLGDERARRRFVIAAVALSVLTAPVMLFRAIGFLPAAACAISLAGLFFTVKPVKIAELQKVA